jgi:hypothetical protein
MMPVSQLLSLSIVPLRNTAWDTVASIMAWIVRLPMMTFPCHLACLHSHASKVLGSLNRMYHVTLAENQCPQY